MWFRNWWTDPYRPKTNVAEKVTVLITAVLAVIGFFQYTVYKQQKAIMESSGQQTQQLVDAANIQACAATKNAASADRFAISADGINQHTADAVSDFSRLAKASEDAASRASEAIKSTRESFQQDQRAWIGVSEFRTINFDEVNGVQVDVSLINSGKTPARSVEQADGYSIPFTAISGPSAIDIDNMRQHFTQGQAIPPQGKLFLHIGRFAAGRAANSLYEFTGSSQLITSFPQIRDGSSCSITTGK